MGGRAPEERGDLHPLGAVRCGAAWGCVTARPLHYSLSSTVLRNLDAWITLSKAIITLEESFDLID